MKFDVVVGNPPYQSTNKGVRNIGSPLWPKFIEQSAKLLKENAIMAMVLEPDMEL